MISRNSISSNTAYPKGLIPRIENSKVQLDFIKNNEDIRYVMIDIHKIEQFLKKGINSSYFKPNIKVITTTTVHDDILARYHFEKELEIITQFDPNFHIPCDFPMYLNQPEKERLWFLNNYLEDLKRFYHETKNLDIHLIPLVKGLNEIERELCFNLFKELNINHISYYAAQYFGRGRGNRKRELSIDIRNIISESGFQYLLVIGIQSLSCFKMLPPQVIAASGLHQWIVQSDLRRNSIEVSRNKYNAWKVKIEKKLSCGDDILEIYNTK